MRLKATQSGLKTCASMGAGHFIRFVTMSLPVQSIKYLAILFGFLFSINTFAVGDLLGCNSSHTVKRYNNLHKLIKSSSNVALIYNLAKTSLCLGKKEEGMSHLQRASDSKHVAATNLLGRYYEHDQTFDSSKFTSDMQNINDAIHYYTKAAKMIGGLSSYPKGATKDMEHIESVSYVSYYVFKGLPNLYLSGYFVALDNITGSGKRVSYDHTLEVLNNVRVTAILCVRRPALYAWNGKRNIIYKAQQIKCNAFLHFAQVVYPLEQQRIQVANNCRSLPKECPEHQQVMSQIDQQIDEMFNQVDSAPKFH